MRISDWSSDVCSSDLVARRSREPDAAPFAADGFDVAQQTELVDDLNKMVAGDSIALRDFRDRRQAVPVESEIHEHTERILRVERKPHRRTVYRSDERRLGQGLVS